MEDKVLDLLREARAAILEERDGNNGTGGTRELAIALVNLETAILWRQEDLRLKRGLP